MKLQITQWEMPGGSHFSIIPLDEGFPTDLAELGGNRVIEVSDEEGKSLLDAQSQQIRHQVNLAKKFSEPISK